MDCFDDQCVLDLERPNEVQPYLFEPIPRHADTEETDSHSDSESEPDPDLELQNQMDDEPTEPVSAWCTCDNCEQMPTRIENKCCRSYPAIRGILGRDTKCIADHPGFTGNCLNIYVLEASVYEFVHDNGRLGDDEPLDEMMRYLAYRRFARWVYGILGKKNRRVTPACAVRRIRQQFPQGFRHGFRYPVY